LRLIAQALLQQSWYTTYRQTDYDEVNLHIDLEDKSI
jgi:hypothetical protein